MSAPQRIMSIGHSNHSADRFVALLGAHEVEMVADVRTRPYSRYSPHFTQSQIRPLLGSQDVRYVFMGDELGGRPDDPSCYDADGHVLYGVLARTATFEHGLDQLVAAADSLRVAMMCSEEVPAQCHRHLLIARVLGCRGIEVLHIRGDGSTVAESELEQPSAPVQGDLYGDPGEHQWRSVRSVSPAARPRVSSQR